MPLNLQQTEVLLSAIKEYDYPPELYNFQVNEKIVFKNMRELEGFLKKRLMSNDIKELKYAFANIIYWGNLNSGYCAYRVRKFLNEITEEKLRTARELFANIKGDSLVSIKNVGLPQFSNMSFVSKLRMFLDPQNFVTLDMKLLKLKGRGTFFDNISKQRTYIPINNLNIRQYLLWCQKCKVVASSYFKEKGVIAVDVERGVFKMVDKGKLSEASIILVNM